MDLTKIAKKMVYMAVGLCILSFLYGVSSKDNHIIITCSFFIAANLWVVGSNIVDAIAVLLKEMERDRPICSGSRTRKEKGTIS